MKINKDLGVNDVSKLLYGAYLAEEDTFKNYLANRFGPSKIPKFPKKLPGSIWAITTFFNPAKYKNKYENYLLFRESTKKQGLKLLTVELNYGDIPFEIQEEDADILIRVHGEDKNHLWQKEPMMNIALKHLPADCDKIIWIDCDLIFHNDNWVDETAALLEDYNIVQPYAMAVRLPQFTKTSANMKNMNYGVLDGEIIHGVAKGVDCLGDDLYSLMYKLHGHVGFAWAARKDIFDEIGFFTAMVSGANDSVMAYAFYGLDWYKSVREFLPELADTVTEWRIKAFEKIQGSVFYTDGVVDHLWHGNKNDRGYNNREKLFIEYNFNPRIDIRESESGLLEWCTDKLKFKEAVQNYFHARKEDSSKIEHIGDYDRELESHVTVITNENLGSIPKYQERLTGTIWGITTFFNPAKYKNKYRNYRNFRKNSKRQGLNLITVELSFDDESYEIRQDDTDILVQVQGDENNVLWQKEALLNIALKNLPADCDKVVWLDCDLVFHNDNWVSETAGLLEEYNVVQPFSSVVRLAKDCTTSKSMQGIKYGDGDGQILHGVAKGIASLGVNALKEKTYAEFGQVGFAWAIRRSIIDEVGFIEALVCGGNDSIMTNAFYGLDWITRRGNFSSGLVEKCNDWRNKIYSKVNGSVYFCTGTVDHLWHGSVANRGYKERENIFIKYDFDPTIDLKKSGNGLLEWVSPKKELIEAVKNYFYIRKEDSNSITEASVIPNLDIYNAEKVLYPAFDGDKRMFLRYLDFRLGRIQVPTFPKELPGTIWAITTFFNPAKYKNKYENYKRFRESSKRQGLKLLTVELRFDNEPYEISDKDTDVLVRLQGEDKNILWQKEALLNIAVKNLPADCDKVVWLDCDLIFHNNNWVQETADLLEEYNVVQPYSSIIRLKQGIETSDLLENFEYGYDDNKVFHSVARGAASFGVKILSDARYQNRGSMGYAWSIRKSILDEVKFFDYMILGGADSVMGFAVFGEEWAMSKHYLSPKLKKMNDEWHAKFYAQVQGSVFYTNGLVNHLWHGDQEDRNYNDRYKILRSSNFDPDQDLNRSESGLLEWSTNKRELIDGAKQYFHIRKEQGQLN